MTIIVITTIVATSVDERYFINPRSNYNFGPSMTIIITHLLITTATSMTCATDLFEPATCIASVSKMLWTGYRRYDRRSLIFASFWQTCNPDSQTPSLQGRWTTESLEKQARYCRLCTQDAYACIHPSYIAPTGAMSLDG